jgi:hypothetical protein
MDPQETEARNECAGEDQQQCNRPTENRSPLNNMFRVVATAFQQIMIEANVAESEEDRIVTITKFVLKLMKQNGC